MKELNAAEEMMIGVVKMLMLKKKEDNQYMLERVAKEAPEVAQNGRCAIGLNNKLIDLFVEYAGKESSILYVDYATRLVALAAFMMTDKDLFEDVKFLLEKPHTLHNVVEAARGKASSTKPQVNPDCNTLNGKGLEIVEEFEKFEAMLSEAPLKQ